MATNVQDTIGLREQLQSIDEARCRPFFDAGMRRQQSAELL
jgi:hypothetical protein